MHKDYKQTTYPHQSGLPKRE